MDVPPTVATALSDRPVAGRRCLEAGAGVGKTTAGLLEAGAARVYAMTDDPEHARLTRDRASEHVSVAPDEGSHVPDAADRAGEHVSAASGDGDADRLAVLEADLRAIPLPDDAVDCITAHGLVNVLDPAALAVVAAELRRVAAPGTHLVVDDYDPLPAAAAVRELFAVENAAARVATGRPALTFYPAAVLRRLFAGWGWRVDRERTLLDPVPWTERHLSAHAAATEAFAASCPADVGEPLAARADRLAGEIGTESAGRMYNLALRLPES